MMTNIYHILLGISVFVVFGLTIAVYIFLSLTTQLTTKELYRLEAKNRPTWLVWFMIIPFVSVVIQYFAMIRHIAKPIKKCCEVNMRLDSIVLLIYATFVTHILALILAVLPVEVKLINELVIALLAFQFVANIFLIFKLNKGYKLLKTM